MSAVSWHSRPTLLHQVFEASVERLPGKVALVTEGR
jgi:hypothetical protein